MGKRIFINYRRSDTQTEARLLYDFLNQYEVEKLFYDIDKIELGNNFIEKIEHVLKHETDSVLVLIGHHWENELQKRIDAGDDDYVVEEIDMALAYDLDMIPLLFYRKMPDISRLSRFQRSRIKQRLPYKNGMEIRPDKLQDDFAKLATKLGLSLKPSPKQEDNTHLHTEIASLVQQLKEAHNKDQDIQKQFIENKQVLAQAKQSIENYETQIALSNKKNKENEHVQALLNQQLKEAQADYLALQTRYNEKDQLLAQAKQTIANLETKLAQAQKEVVKTTPTPSIANDFIEMVYVEGGTFQMGSNDGEANEKPIHEVTLSSYYIGKYPVTQRQWKKIMGESNNPSKFKGDNRPVENVSWEDAIQFIKKLSLETNQNYRLPTEAEWEFAARGGNKSKGFLNSGNNNLEEVGWFADNSGGETTEVGKKKPNELGIYDMSGNVWEWCKDWYGAYSAEKQVDPQGIASNSNRVLRGGSWGYNAAYSRVALRNYDSPDYRDYNFGFRLVFVP